jgi:hypothetical protein
MTNDPLTKEDKCEYSFTREHSSTPVAMPNAGIVLDDHFIALLIKTLYRLYIGFISAL